MDFFCTQAPKVDTGKSSFFDGASTNADLKKELNDFRLHVDVKFGEILEALCHLTKKLEEKKSNERCYSRGGDIVFPDLGMDADEDAYKVAPDSTPLMFVKLVWVLRGLTFVSMRESVIASITQDYYMNKEGSQEKERDLKLNSEKLGDDDFFVDMSKSDIALIIQVVVSATTINVNVAVNDEVVVDGGVPRQDAAQPATYVVVEVDDTLGSVARASNEPASGVFVEGVAVNESVVDPPSKDATCEALVGQVAYEVPIRATYTFTGSEHDSPECGIPPGSTIVEIGDDDKTPVVYRRTRNRRPGKAQQSPFVAGSGLSGVWFSVG
ncbi:hypothetical protein HAX54_045101 [Datura stramonium]|uniref:Uncharacterized protein n=1 Tax=Datura stramonium TaxID=4076 RepID=A0ABS8SQB6_DATST|nr:hypothetical protein [Datura stramonium]